MLKKLLGIMLLLMPAFSLGASDYVALQEHLEAFLPGDLVFTREDSSEVRLTDLIERPTIISPVYYNCPGLCTPIMNGLVKLMNRTDLVVGKDFDVINVSFHENETPELAVIKKQNYVSMVFDRRTADHWHFLTGDKQNIDRLLNTLGYSVRRQGEDILHPAAIIIVSPEGKIVKYAQGTSYNPVEFKMAIQSAKDETAMSTITRKLKMCFNYEPEGRNKQRSVTIVGFVMMISIGLILFVAYPPLKNRKTS